VVGKEEKRLFTPKKKSPFFAFKEGERKDSNGYRVGGINQGECE